MKKLIDKFNNSYFRLILLVILSIIAGLLLMIFPERTPLLIIRIMGTQWVIEGFVYIGDIYIKYNKIK